MILRKPLAFLIKHFKFIHFILVLISVYLIYKTSAVLVFFNEYISAINTIPDVADNLASIYITPTMYLLIFLMMLGTALILTILKYKEKPVKFYFFNIFVCVLVLAIFLYDYSILESLENGLVDIQKLELARDLLLLSIIVQNVSLIILGVRAAGFDIKSFNFNENLAELEIDEKDNEEIEIDLDIDKHLYTRYFRKFKRFTKYMLKENKLLVTLSLLIVIAISLYIVYLNNGVYEKKLKTNQAFQTTQFYLNVESSYYTETDYRLKNLEKDKGFVVLRVKAKNKSVTPRPLMIGRMTLVIDDVIYTHDTTYKEKLTDLGFSYFSEEIGTNFTTYIFVYKIPSSFKDKPMTLKYADINNKDIKIDVTPLDLTKERNEKGANITEDLIFKTSPLKDTTFRIDSYDIADRFKINYNYCFDENNCYSSYEYVNATTSSNSKKILLKLNGKVEISDKITVEPITSVYKFMKFFSTIKYKVNDTYKEVRNITRVLPQKTENKNEYYIEVPSDIKNASEIEIDFNIRNYKYVYKLK